MRRNIVYLDETWYDTHDTMKKSCTDNNKKCSNTVPSNRSKRIIILHYGRGEERAEDVLFISAKQISWCRYCFEKKKIITGKDQVEHVVKVIIKRTKNF